MRLISWTLQSGSEHVHHRGIGLYSLFVILVYPSPGSGSLLPGYEDTQLKEIKLKKKQFMFRN